MPRDWIPWTERPENKRLVEQLRQKLSQDDADLLVFLGAGLSYGAGRYLGRASLDDFDTDRHNDGKRFPSWRGLLTRMLERLRTLPDLKGHREELELFFKEQGPLDCAEVFRKWLGESNYFDFLREQFQCSPNNTDILTRSHHELVKLNPKLIFTTNYDELIEMAFQVAGRSIRRSTSLSEFMNNMSIKPDTHLVKLHGSIDQPDTIVLTRMDYARSRRDRIEMFRYLGERLRYTSFLFIGFSLSDPNFGLVEDEARLARSDIMPVSYTVQGSSDVIRDSYLRSMGVNTICLDSWNQLPQFFQAINH